MKTKTVTPMSIQERHELIRKWTQQPSDSLYSSTLVLPNTQTLYAIPSQILQALCSMQPIGQKKKPFLTETEYQVERTWTEHCESHDIIGCSVRGNISFPLLHRDDSQPSEDYWKGFEDLANWAYKRFAIDQKVDFHRYRDALQRGTKTVSEFNEQRLAYLGWLCCNSLFTLEKNHLVTAWSQDGGNPAYLGGRNLLAQVPHLPGQAKDSWQLNRDLSDQFLSFYRRWDLDGFVSWDLPIQQNPNLGGSAGLGEMMGLHNNPAIQLPSSMKFPTTQHAQHFLNQTPVDHMKEWRDILENKCTKQYAEAFVIYFYQELVLRKILGERLHRCQTTLDELLVHAFQQKAPLASLRTLRSVTITDLRQKFTRLRTKH